MRSLRSSVSLLHTVFDCGYATNVQNDLFRLQFLIEAIVYMPG